MKRTKSRRQPARLWALPSGAMLLCLTVAPIAMLLLFSFMDRNIFAGQPWPGWTLGNLTRLLGSESFWLLLGKSLAIGAAVTLLCVLLGYPAAWAIAKAAPERWRSGLILLVILPFFTSQLLLIYAMMNLIQSGGLLLTLLKALGLEASSILYTNKATVLVLVYEYLPYMILCLYSSMESIDDNLLRASHSLGANRRQTFQNIVFPLSLPGLLSGVLLVFVPVVGSFAEPALVGGSGGMMLGSLINSQYKDNLNMGYGAVMSCVLLIVLCLIMALLSFAARRTARRIGGEAE